VCFVTLRSISAFIYYIYVYTKDIDYQKVAKRTVETKSPHLKDFPSTALDLSNGKSSIGGHERGGALQVVLSRECAIVSCQIASAGILFEQIKR
jgi:hypothetical protein